MATLTACGSLVDREVVVDGNLIFGRNPDDLPAFCRTLVEQLAAHAHDQPVAPAVGSQPHAK